MRDLTVDTSKDPVTSDILFALQLRTANEPLFPRLELFACMNAAEAFIPFIPSFLSCNITSIYIDFTEGLPVAVVASMITRLSTLCSDLCSITLNPLPRDPVITEAVSDMFLTCNRDSLRWFRVDSPLTDEAYEIIFQLPELSELWVVIQGHTQIPPVVLPNLSTINLEYDDRLDWLQGFRGVMLGELENVYFTSHSQRIGDFLGEFTRVALTTSAPSTLSTFYLNTSWSWDPNYRSLLPLTQLKNLLIESPCGHCSSRIDDSIIMDLAQAMPKLEILKLGDAPCGAERGVTFKGLIALARGCRHLSKLRIHFQAASLVAAVTDAGVPASLGDETAVRGQDCVLTDLEVGKIPIPTDSALTVAMVLLQIFPRLHNIEPMRKEWRDVAENIKLFQRIGSLVQRAGKVCLLYRRSSSVMFLQATRLSMGTQRNNAFRRFSLNIWDRACTVEHRSKYCQEGRVPSFLVYSLHSVRIMSRLEFVPHSSIASKLPAWSTRG